MADLRDLVNLLVQDGTVTSIVPAARITSFPAAQDSPMPAITYRELSRNPTTKLSGRPVSDFWSVELNAYARDTATLKSLLNAMIAAVELNAVVESVGPMIYVEELDVRRQPITVSYFAQR